MKNIIVCILSIFLSPYFFNTAWANIEFNIHVMETTEKTKAINESNMSVDLGNHYFSYIQNDLKYIYDFVKKRIIKIALSKKIYTDDSLFSDIGLRAYTFQNRLGSDSEGKAVPSYPVLNEHMFSLKKDGMKSEISETLKEGMVCFSSANKNLLAYSNEGYDVSRDDKEIFMKFFRYIFGGHPQILAKLARDHTIPKKIWVYYYGDTEKIKALGISALKTTPTHFFSLVNYTPGVLAKDEDGFLHFLHKVKHSENIDLIKYMATLLKEADTHFQEGFYLDAMLTFIEYRFVSGLPFPTDFENKKFLLESDDNVFKFFKAIQPPENDDAAPEHLTVLTSLEKEAKFKKHVIWLFKANTHLKVGNLQEAKKLFHKALKANTNIALAYKDLGGIYFKESNTKIAWRCWDVARKITPGHRRLMYLDGYEKKFEMDYPEFF